MSASWFLAVAVLGCYAAMRLSRLANWYQLAAILRFIALWFLATFFGYGTPIYVGLLMIPIALVWAVCRRRRTTQICIELAVLAGLIWFSQMRISPMYIGILLLFDQAITRTMFFRDEQTTPLRIGQHRIIVVAFSILSLLAVGYLCRNDAVRYLNNHQLVDLVQFQPQGLPHLWLAKHELSQGVYWKSRYPTDTDKCAIVFHGANSDGSLQSTARSIFNSLLLLDVRVYGVDHPGFGASPTPPNVEQPLAWDPARLTAAVEDEMQAHGCRERYVIGHSQGTTEALRLLSQGDQDYAGYIVMGAGLYEKNPSSDQYWYDRFHSDRRIPTRLRFEDWRAIRNQYYLNETYCKASPEARNRKESNRLLYIVFANEHANLARTREQLWNCLDYPSGQWQEFDSGHYLNSARVGPFTFVSRPHVASLAQVLEGELLASNNGN